MKSLSALAAPIRSEKAFKSTIYKQLAKWQLPLQAAIRAAKHPFEKSYDIRMALSVVDYAQSLDEKLNKMREDLSMDIRFILRFWFSDDHSSLQKWLANHAEYIREDIDTFLRNWTEDGELPAKADIAEYSGLDVAELIYTTYDAARAMQTLLEEAPKFLVRIERSMRISLMSQDSMQNSLDDIEIVYHATAFKTEILRDGFKAEQPMERKGLGTYGKIHGISFTYDLYTAKEIARCLKEVQLIVHGKLSYAQILDWFVRDKLNVDEAQQRVKREKSHASAVEKALYLYNYYLWVGKRYNPVFTYIENLANLFQNRQASDIGVVKCWIRTDAIIEHKPAEKEILAPSSSVVKLEDLF